MVHSCIQIVNKYIELALELTHEENHRWLIASQMRPHSFTTLWALPLAGVLYFTQRTMNLPIPQLDTCEGQYQKSS